MSSRFRSRRWNFPSRVRYARGRYGGRRVGSSARRARGNMRASNQQNDISNVTINLMKKIKTGVLSFSKFENGKSNKYDIGTCALNIFELLKKSDFYESYSNMYDQFRINRIQVKLTPVTWQTYNQFNLPNKIETVLAHDSDNNMEDPKEHYYGDVDAKGEPQYPLIDGHGYQGPSLNNTDPTKRYIVPQALTVVTAWDRTGLDDTQITTCRVDGNDYKVITIGDRITTYSSAKTTQLVAGANFNCVRYLYPSSQQEKSLYFSTSDLVTQIQDPAANQKWYTFTEVGGANSNKITNLKADPNCPFKPTLLIGVLKVDETYVAAATQEAPQTNPESSFGQIYPVTFNLEFDIGVTFRGLRKTQVV